jgi:hypothetical protein
MKIEIENTRKLVVNGTEREFDISILPENVLSYIVDYGLRQVLNDAHASALDNVCPHNDPAKFETKAEYNAARRTWGKEEENQKAINAERESLIDAKWQRLVAGELRVSGGGKAGLTPLETMVYTVAREWLKAAMDAQGIDKAKFTKLDKAEQYEKLDAYIEAEGRDSVEAEAQKRLDNRKAAAKAVSVADLLS